MEANTLMVLATTLLSEAEYHGVTEDMEDSVFDSHSRLHYLGRSQLESSPSGASSAGHLPDSSLKAGRRASRATRICSSGGSHTDATCTSYAPNDRVYKEGMNKRCLGVEFEVDATKLHCQPDVAELSLGQARLNAALQHGSTCSLASRRQQHYQQPSPLPSQLSVRYVLWNFPFTGEEDDVPGQKRLLRDFFFSVGQLYLQRRPDGILQRRSNLIFLHCRWSQCT